MQERDHRFLFILCVDRAILFDTNIRTILPQQHDIQHVDPQGVNNDANDCIGHQKLSKLAALDVDCAPRGQRHISLEHATGRDMLPLTSVVGDQVLLPVRSQRTAVTHERLENHGRCRRQYHIEKQ